MEVGKQKEEEPQVKDTEEKLPKPKERDTYQGPKFVQNTKQMGGVKGNPPCHIIVKRVNTQNKGRILRAARQKDEIT